eukprot:436899_1
MRSLILVYICLSTLVLGGFKFQGRDNKISLTTGDGKKTKTWSFTSGDMIIIRPHNNQDDGGMKGVPFKYTGSAAGHVWTMTIKGGKNPIDGTPTGMAKKCADSLDKGMGLTMIVSKNKELVDVSSFAAYSGYANYYYDDYDVDSESSGNQMMLLVEVILLAIFGMFALICCGVIACGVSGFVGYKMGEITGIEKAKIQNEYNV